MRILIDECVPRKLTFDFTAAGQQNITQRNIAILIIRAKSNRIADVRSHVANCLMVLRSIRRGEIVEIGKTDS
jgi:hypothetical protein